MGAFFFALLVQSPNTGRMLKAPSSMPALPPGGAPPAGGPPPEIVALGKKLQLGGIYLTLSVVAIATLMVWKPGASFH